MNDLLHKRESGMSGVEDGAIRVELEHEVHVFPGSWPWAIDSTEVRIYQPDGSLVVYPIHRLCSVRDDRAADHSEEKVLADAEIDKQMREMQAGR